MEKKMRKTLPLALLALGLASCAKPVTPAESASSLPASLEENSSSLPKAKTEDDRDIDDYEFTSSSLVSVDALGRQVKAAKQENGKQVGMFYFLWHGSHETGIYDVTQLLQSDPEVVLSTESSSKSPIGKFHYWGKPLYGYYDSSDPYVITRHLELFLDSGVDYLLFDVTNTVTYLSVFQSLCQVFDAAQKQGFKVPKIAFYTNTASGDTIDILYANIYQENLYPNLWLMLDDKPFIVGNPATMSDEQYAKYTEYFSMKNSQWPDTAQKLGDGFPWMDWSYPQNNFRGTMSVSVAQGPDYTMADPTSARGRGFNYMGMKNEDDKVLEGQNYQQQWNTALHPDEETGKVKNVFLTGWNEWMAIKQNINGRIVYCDQYDEDYSRDLEMEDGKLGDNFYLQTLQNVRAFKYEEADSYLYPSQTIDFATGAGFEKVKHAYLDLQGDAIKRNYKDCVLNSANKYTDDSARNDIVSSKVAHDDANLYLKVDCASTITAPEESDASWMNVLLNGYGSGEKWANNFDYRLNSSRTATTCSLERFESGAWKKVSDVDYRLDDKTIYFKIPLTAIGKTKEDVHLSFKVSDHVSKRDDIMDYYVSGDSAPIGRLSYDYGY